MSAGKPSASPQPASQSVVLEVAASSAPSEVISAIVASAATPASRASNPNRWLLTGFFFVLIFGCIVYFREEIYAFSTDLHKYPILSVAESLQVRKYLGSGWTFGSGQDAMPEIDPNADASKAPVVDAAVKLIANVTANVTAAASAAADVVAANVTAAAAAAAPAL